MFSFDDKSASSFLQLLDQFKGHFALRRGENGKKILMEFAEKPVLIFQ